MLIIIYHFNEADTMVFCGGKGIWAEKDLEHKEIERQSLYILLQKILPFW